MLILEIDVLILEIVVVSTACRATNPRINVASRGPATARLT